MERFLGHLCPNILSQENISFRFGLLRAAALALLMECKGPSYTALAYFFKTEGLSTTSQGLECLVGYVNCLLDNVSD